MGKHVVEGKYLLLHTRGKGSQLVNEEVRSDRPALWTDEEFENLSVSAGRTLSLGNYEFARVMVGIKASLVETSNQSARDAAYVKMRDAIEEILDREEAYIKGEDRRFSSIDIDGVGVKISVWLEYGLTFKVKGQDSNKVDISMSRRVSDAGSVEEVIEELSKDVGNKIGKYKQQVLGYKDDVGL